jgi:putative hydrolase of the HAD superfamily
MAEPTAVFWDIGGVLLSNAWDHDGRRAAAARFGLNEANLERRHEEVAARFETGGIGLAEYLTWTVFDRPQAFSREEFWAFMQSRSTEIAPALAAALALKARGAPLMVALNNESLDLNAYRIRAFGLRRIFDVFLSSCLTGRRKPDEGAYRLALALTQREPSEVLFVDDREENIAAAESIGLRTAWVRRPADVIAALGREGWVMDVGGN